MDEALPTLWATLVEVWSPADMREVRSWPVYHEELSQRYPARAAVLPANPLAFVLAACRDAVGQRRTGASEWLGLHRSEELPALLSPGIRVGREPWWWRAYVDVLTHACLAITHRILTAGPGGIDAALWDNVHVREKARLPELTHTLLTPGFLLDLAELIRGRPARPARTPPDRGRIGVLLVTEGEDDDGWAGDLTVELVAPASFGSDPPRSWIYPHPEQALVPMDRDFLTGTWNACLAANRILGADAAGASFDLRWRLTLRDLPADTRGTCFSLAGPSCGGGFGLAALQLLALGPSA